jgi:hypothetical protein
VRERWRELQMILIRLIVSIILGTVATYFGIAALRILVIKSPFAILEISLLLVSVIFIMLSIRLMKGDSIAKNLAIVSISILAGVLPEAVIGSRREIGAADAGAIAFNYASMRCQEGFCRYDPKAGEKFALLGADVIYSILQEDEFGCAVLSVAMNSASYRDSLFVDYEKYKLAGYFSKTRLMDFIFYWYYPDITLISRSEVPCLQDDLKKGSS